MAESLNTTRYSHMEGQYTETEKHYVGDLLEQMNLFLSDDFMIFSIV